MLRQQYSKFKARLGYIMTLKEKGKEKKEGRREVGKEVEHKQGSDRKTKKTKITEPLCTSMNKNNSEFTTAGHVTYFENCFSCF